MLWIGAESILISVFDVGDEIGVVIIGKKTAFLMKQTCILSSGPL